MSYLDGNTHCEFCNIVAKEVSALRYEVSWYKKKLEQSQIERARLEREVARSAAGAVVDTTKLDPERAIMILESEFEVPHVCGSRRCGAACG
jgi:hypothetical protein